MNIAGAVRVAAVFAAVAVVAAGCAPAPTGPHSSFGSFVKLQDHDESEEVDDSGKVSAAVGARGIGHRSFVVPSVAGHASWWLHDNYDLVGTFDVSGLGAQGMVTVVDDGVRVGFVHGLAGNVGDEIERVGNATAGVFVQGDFRNSSTPYGGVRMSVPFGDEVDFDEEYVDVSVGWTDGTGDLQLGPEVTAKAYPDPFDVLMFSANLRLEGTF